MNAKLTKNIIVHDRFCQVNNLKQHAQIFISLKTDFIIYVHQ